MSAGPPVGDDAGGVLLVAAHAVILLCIEWDRPEKRDKKGDREKNSNEPTHAAPPPVTGNPIELGYSPRLMIARTKLGGM